MNMAWACCDKVTKLDFSVVSTFIIIKHEISILISWIKFNTQKQNIFMNDTWVLH